MPLASSHFCYLCLVVHLYGWVMLVYFYGTDLHMVVAVPSDLSHHDQISNPNAYISLQFKISNQLNIRGIMLALWIMI